MNQLVTIQTFSSRLEAEIVKGKLASEGIEAVIFADDAGGMYPFLANSALSVELKVRKEDLQKAQQILKKNH